MPNSVRLITTAYKCATGTAALAAGSKNCSGNRTPSDRKVTEINILSCAMTFLMNFAFLSRSVHHWRYRLVQHGVYYS